ncbi:MAG: DUF4129 domain-containing protein [Actinobacteria bacterium]|nr:DUF4129 domain-containing protein [Actinomycetota bacterium]
MVRDDARIRRLPLPGALAIVVLVTVVLMGVASLQGAPRFGDIGLPRGLPFPMPTADEQTPGAGVPQPLPDSPVLAMIASVIAIVIAAVGLVLMGWLFWRMIRGLWAGRPLRRQDGADVATGGAVGSGDEPVDADAIRTAAVDAQQVIDAHRDPGDAIVAAWVHLEEASARAGRARAAAETPGEFTMRILRRRPGLDRELETLLGLYESVRFGGRLADEAARDTARSCLLAIEEGWR